MNKAFYRYNPETLNYERVYLSKGQRIWAIFRQLFIGIGVGFLLFSVATYLIDSPKERQLKKENKLLLAQYHVLSKQIDENQKILTDLQERDDHLYRAIFNADPIPASIRKPGFGGTNRYESLMEMPNSELIISTTRKLDIMTKELYVQSNSYDELSELIKSKEERMRNIPAIIPIVGKDLIRISSGFGMRVHPVYGVLKPHTGIDLNAKKGTPIYATGNGTVESAKWEGGYGNSVVINHGFGYKTRYAHCTTMTVRPGQKVLRGQQIATVGTTGTSTGYHLHYEVILKGVHDNPAKYFFMDLTPEEYDEILFISENR